MVGWFLLLYVCFFRCRFSPLSLPFILVRRLMREVNIMRRLQHPNIIRLVEALDSSEQVRWLFGCLVWPNCLLSGLIFCLGFGTYFTVISGPVHCLYFTVYTCMYAPQRTHIYLPVFRMYCLCVFRVECNFIYPPARLGTVDSYHLQLELNSITNRGRSRAAWRLLDNVRTAQTALLYQNACTLCRAACLLQGAEWEATMSYCVGHKSKLCTMYAVWPLFP